MVRSLANFRLPRGEKQLTEELNKEESFHNQSWAIAFCTTAGNFSTTAFWELQHKVAWLNNSFPCSNLKKRLPPNRWSLSEFLQWQASYPKGSKIGHHFKAKFFDTSLNLRGCPRFRGTLWPQGKKKSIRSMTRFPHLVKTTTLKATEGRKDW